MAVEVCRFGQRNAELVAASTETFDAGELKLERLKLFKRLQNMRAKYKHMNQEKENTTE